MKKYGLRIGDVGVEFSDLASRDKALRDFTQGSDVSISNTGVKYTDGNGAFSVYERDTNEILVTCCKCKGTFGIESCGEREYPILYSWQKDKPWNEATDYICDACLARANKEKKIYDAKKELSTEE
jgi:hypothetical protein